MADMDHPGGIPRAFEVLLALAGIIITLPLLFLIAALVCTTSQGPVFFRQSRMGRCGTPFTLVKFRSMYVNSAGPQVTAKGDSRVTPLGRLLRKAKLDELPQFLNVLQGHLSLVGPRPEVPKYVALDNPLWQQILQCRPGITDPVTLSLRNEEELLESLPGDPEDFYLSLLQPYKLLGYMDYIQDRTWRTDVRVLLASIRAVLFPSATQAPTIEEIRKFLIKKTCTSSPT